MKKTLISMAILLAATAAQAQVTVPEPEFLHSYCLLTSDSTYVALPKENGMFGEHQTKVKKTMKAVGKVANLASAAGGLGAIVGANTGNLNGVIGGIRTASTAAHVGSVAGAASGLAGAEGRDIVFSGPHSKYTFKALTLTANFPYFCNYL